MELEDDGAASLSRRRAVGRQAGAARLHAASSCWSSSSLISILAAMGMVQHRNSVLRPGGDVEDRSLPHARRHRSVLRRQGQVSGVARRARDATTTCGRSPRTRSRGRPTRGRRCRRSPIRAIRPPSRASTTSRAAPRERRSTGRNTRTGNEDAGPHAASATGGRRGHPWSEGKAASRSSSSSSCCR